MKEDNQCLIVARKEFTDVLVDLLYRPIYVGIQSIWEDTKSHYPPREVYGKFQDKLLKISKWNQTVITNEHRRIVDKSKCEYLDALIQKVFVLHTQLLAATSSRPNRKIKLNIPKTDDFIHRCYEMCGRAFYENPLLMEDRTGDTRKRVRNLQESNTIIKDCICTTIRTLLPVGNLLQEDLEEADVVPNVDFTQEDRGREQREQPQGRDQDQHREPEPIPVPAPVIPPPPPPPPVKEPERLVKVYFNDTKVNRKETVDSDTDEDAKSIHKSEEADPIPVFNPEAGKGVNLDVDSEDEIPIRKMSNDVEHFFDSDNE